MNIASASKLREQAQAATRRITTRPIIRDTLRALWSASTSPRWPGGRVVGAEDRVLRATAQIRRPKSEIRTKSEYRNPNQKGDLVEGRLFEIRISDFFRASGFGF